MVLQQPRPILGQVLPPVITWEPLPADYVLPDDPVENIQQPWLAAALTDALDTAGLLRSEMLVVSNFALVATVNGKTIVKAPDWLYVPRVEPIDGVRRSYTQGREGDPVAVVMEFLSEEDCGELSARLSYPYGKLYFYEQILRVPTYVTFDPIELTLEVRQLEGDRYVLQSADAAGRFWIPALNLSLGVWYGTRLEQQIHWLRWWDSAGALLPWAAEQASQERSRADLAEARAEAAEAELARLRSQLAGHDPV
jgi:Uma2 family endonuclease